MTDEEEEVVREMAPRAPDFTISAQHEAEIQQLLDLDSASDMTLPVPSVETGIKGKDGAHTGDFGSVEPPYDPNQRATPPGGVEAQEIYMYLVKGAMRRMYVSLPFNLLTSK